MSAVRYLADYHTHSRISPDARHPMTEMARAAAEAGLDEICFTDHVEPILLGSGALRDHYDWAALAAEYAAARKDWDGKLTLRLGIELGEAVRDLPRTERLLADAPELDFIIGSIHALSEAFGHEGLYTFCPADEVILEKLKSL